MNKFVDLSSGLSVDYEKLYESGKYTDISIHVGKEPDSKIFFAHTLILCTRSAFLEDKLMETADGIQKTAITFEDVKPDVFEILLRYIYTGQMSYDSCKNIGWISLLDGASKLELLDLLGTIETCLIDEQEEWIQQNIITVHKYAASTVTLNKLHDYCNQLVISHPDIILKSNDIATLPKESLITLLKNDDLSMDEDDIWMSVVQWATKQVPELELGNDPDDWSVNEINIVKDIIADCIPHIRFFSISPDKVALYYDLLPRKLGRDLLNYQMNKNYRPITHMLPPRRHKQGCHIDSLIIDKKQAKWISSKIIESTRQLQENQGTSMNQADVYEFTLLYRQSRDGTTVEKFKELCNNKGPTIIVGKALNTEEILGGYNSFAWGSHDQCTKESFVFMLDKNIVSYVDNVESHCSIFRMEFAIDLHFGNGMLRPCIRKDSCKVPVLTSSNCYFEYVNWEVFLVSKV